MPDAQGRTGFYLPRVTMEEIVLPKQRRIYEETGEVLTVGRVVVRLLEEKHAADTQQIVSHMVSSGAR